MRNTRLIILICALGGLAAVIIIMSAVFTVYDTDAVCGTSYAEDGEFYKTVLDVNKEVKAVADEFKLNNIFLFDKDKVLNAVNDKVARAEAYEVECLFPNKIVVHYRLVTEDLQFESGGKYVVTGSSGKIVRVNDYDATDVNGGHYNETLISVTPSAPPDSASVCDYIYTDPMSYDMQALNVIVGLPEILVDEDGRRAFDKAVYKSIDLSSASTIIVKTRNGVTFKLLGGSNNLLDKVQSMVSWYVFAEDSKTMRGVATISDVNPKRVTYSAKADM